MHGQEPLEQPAYVLGERPVAGSEVVVIVRRESRRIFLGKVAGERAAQLREQSVTRGRDAGSSTSACCRAGMYWFRT